MAENSKIEWCDHTFNPWIGCTEVSTACDHCYARMMSERYGWARWGNNPRHRTSEANWRKPLAWNAKAEKLGIRYRVFCASLADVFDNQVPGEWRSDLFDLIRLTPFLDWLLLTKRPQNIAKMVERDALFGKLPENVWLGTTVENEDERAKRVGHLLSVPGKFHFLSCEPLLERIRLPAKDTYWHALDWVICGGESGSGARMMDPAWARHLRDECSEMGIAFFMKQMTGKAPIPEDLRIRQFPARAEVRDA